MSPENYWKIALGMLAILFLWNLINFAVVPIIILFIIGYGFVYRKSWATFFYFGNFIIMLVLSLSMIGLGLTLSDKVADTITDEPSNSLSVPSFKNILGAVDVTDIVKEVYEEYVFAILVAGIGSFILSIIFLFVGWKARSHLSK